jgi:mono/diheme cytochrome c family protein
MREPARRRNWRGLIAAATLLLAGAAAQAENLDAGKSGARLFADNCKTCHRSARGLAKGRFRLTLYLFLQKHYSSGSDSASALASYLQSVDAPPAAAPRAAKSARVPFRPSRPPRPPMSVPSR